MQGLIEKELNSNDKILKPDFNSKTGRELLAFYLQTKFKQILSHDRKCETPIFIDVNPNFISRFSGESASGKSTICKKIKEIIGQYEMPVSILSTDNYFNDISALINKYGSFDSLIENGYDIDSPKSFQLDILKSDLIDLSEGLNIKAPMYLPNGTGVSVPHSLDISSEKVIVVEGIATMYEDVKDVFDVKIYVEADNDIRKARFMKRACEERNQSYEKALQHWNYLEHTGSQHVRPCRQEADFVLNGNSNLKYLALVLEYIHTITNNFM